MKSDADINLGMHEEAEQIVVGWSPDCDESRFAVSPTRFCMIHRLTPCQAGIVRFLSRYQFEKNPWLIDQSCLLARLLIEFGNGRRLPAFCRLRKKMGFKQYLSPRIRTEVSPGLSVSTYCLVNGIAPEILVPLGLVCNAPTQANVEHAITLMNRIKSKR